MPAVLVHGVPDTPRVWDRLHAELARDDVITLRLPGFGCPRPDGFAATKEAYVDWLLAELDVIAPVEGAVDLVGHDWGSLLVARAASLRPAGLRTWAVGGGPIDRTYVWHDTAQLWQTPEVGEQVMAALTPELLAPGLEGAGLPHDEAVAVAELVGDVMTDCILDLYRSAVTVSDEWEDDLRTVEAPGLIIWGRDDPFAAPVHGERMAATAGARFVVVDSGHWWQVERPAIVAAELEAHWAAAD